MITPESIQSPTDGELVEAVRSGHNDSFEDLVSRYERTIYAIIWSRLRDHTLTEDLVQESFLISFRHLSQLRNPERFGVWLGRIAKSLAIRTGRQMARGRKAISELVESGMANRNAESNVDVDMHKTLERLSDKDREAIVLFYLEDRNVRECARLLGVSETAFKTRLHRARSRMKTELLAQDAEKLQVQVDQAEFSRRIMGSLPVTVFLGNSKGLLGFPAVFLGLIPMMSTWGLVWVAHRGQMNNFRTHADTRKRVAGRNALVAFLVVTISVILIVKAGHKYGYSAMYAWLSIFMGCVILASLWHSRLVRTPFIWGTIIGNIIVAVSFGLVAVSLLPREAAMASFFFYNLLLFWGNKSRPYRQDYNLFLRSCMGLLSPTAIQPMPSASMDDLKRFSVFLGSRYLVNDRKQFERGLKLYLAPIRVSPLMVMMPIPSGWQQVSWVDINLDGRVRASVSQKDLNALRKLFGRNLEPSQLELDVASAVQCSFAAFVRGDEDTAQRILQNETDGETFHAPPHNLFSNRFIIYISIGSGAFLFAVFLMKLF